MSSSSISSTVTTTVILGTAAGDYPSPLTITGAGYIDPAAPGAIGVYSNYMAASVTNKGDIFGGRGAYGLTAGGTGGTGVDLIAGVVANDGTGRITGGHGGYTPGLTGGLGGVGVDLSSASAAVSNAGHISGGAGGDAAGTGGIGGGGGGGVVLTGGALTNTTTGVVAGGYGGSDLTAGGGGKGGVGVDLAAGTVANSGRIFGGGGAEGGGGSAGAGAAGVYVTGGALTNKAGGSISGGAGGPGNGAAGGSGGAGVFLNGGSLTTSGTISGGLGGSGASIGAAGDSVQFGGAASTMVVDSGAVFNGAIGGFTFADTIDIANLTPTAAYADFNKSTYTLTSTLLQNDGTLKFAGSFTGEHLVFATDGSGGTDISLVPGSVIRGAVTKTVTVGSGAGDYTGPLTITNTGSVNLSLLANLTGGAGVINGSPAGGVTNQGEIIAGTGIIYAAGGAGVQMNGGTLTNSTTGQIAGGTGGYGSGGGGMGVDLSAGGLNNSGHITGGAGSRAVYGGGVGGGGYYGGGGYGGPPANAGLGGSGGTGAKLGAGTVATNSGSITGGSGGDGYNVGGRGGIGVYLKGGALTNSGSIAGGAGGISGQGPGGTGGAGVYLDGGTLTTSGAISFGLGGAAYGGSTAGANGDAVRFGAAVGTLIVDPGAVFTGQVAANSAVNDTLELAGASDSTLTGFGSQFTGFSTLDFASGAAWTVDTTSAGIAAVKDIDGFAINDTIDITNLTLASRASDTFSGDVLTIVDGSTTLKLNFIGTFAGEHFVLTADGHGGTDITCACYCRGTRILAVRGEVNIESLKIGDRVMTSTGITKPIRWIGRRSYSGEAAWANREVLPIRINAGALGEGLPRRDLWVSPEHAMYIDGMLILAAALVNGVSIVQEEWIDEVTYIHLEFDAHAVIYAEGALAESFVDDESRAMFDNAAQYAVLYPHAVREPARFCAPRVEDGEELEFVRRRLAVRAEKLPATSAAAREPLSREYDRRGDDGCAACTPPLIIEAAAQNERLLQHSG
jgi:hypothetical protein